MDSINDSIARAMGSKPPKPASIPIARECMSTGLTTFRKDEPIRAVVKVLINKKISGGPVVDGSGALVGMISELDCLRALAGSAFEGHYGALERLVADEMTSKCLTVSPEDNVYTMAHLFEKHLIRCLPVIERGVLIGQVSRRDVLLAILESE